ncbi:MAG: hypothetical protein H0W53_03210 [Acidobacteria bacterium]|nr:hypothetical protein [Acidobacteriota bacterium]
MLPETSREPSGRAVQPVIEARKLCTLEAAQRFGEGREVDAVEPAYLVALGEVTRFATES